MFKISRMRKSHIPAVAKMMGECYEKNYFEDDIFVEKSIKSYPKGCLVLIANREIAGYIFFHPFMNNKIKKLNTPYKKSAAHNCMYIHDLAIRKKYRRKGLSNLLLKKVNHASKNMNLDMQALVAVQHTEKFWEKHGFIAAKKIDYYGKKASCMKKSIDSLIN